MRIGRGDACGGIAVPLRGAQQLRAAVCVPLCHAKHAANAFYLAFDTDVVNVCVADIIIIRADQEESSYGTQTVESDGMG